MKKIKLNKKVLVTGGAGYIGSVLINQLIKKNYQVVVFDNFYWGKEHLKDVADKIKIIKTDIRKINLKHLKGIEAVIHLAALSNDPMADFNPKANYEINTEATKKLALLCKKSGIKRFTFSSSASIYDRGYLGKNRIKNEDFVVKPKKAYSVSKYKAENELLKLANHDFCPVIFRTGTVYGFSPRMRYDLVVNTMVKDALKNKEINIFCGGVQWRPLVDVTDVAQAYIKAIEAPEEKVNGQIFNLIYDNYQILDLAKRVKNIFKKKLNLEIKINNNHSRKKDRSYRISGKKIKKVLNWEPKKSVEESIKDMIVKIDKYGYTDFTNYRYYNIEWMKKKLTSF